MEALHCMLDKVVEMGELEGLRFGNGEKPISHLFYANDALLMGFWTKDNVEKVARILRVFHICLGLKINTHKSHLFGIGVHEGEVDSMTNVLWCQVGSVPFDYLGIRVGANMNRVSHWITVIESVQNRLSLWKAKTLSIGGRLTLIKSVLSSLPIYYLSLYKAPIKILEKLERLMKNFLWSGSNDVKKVHWVVWEVVTTPKKRWGLGIEKLADVNLALIAKWGWRFTIEKDAL
ncbi:uncharacterized protein LOC110892608 [Helianthus annuus]|uniref:uncharacterized protein LOC110892608 n=1 Tax=Helianthus annuus TaxID=4232 RepID=UPI000B8FE210|nr:uncharacterized protein LOC110892608 [Helianthus annuus]